MKKKQNNIHAQLYLEKITLSSGIKRLVESSNAYSELENDLLQITTQKPKRLFAKKNNDRFHLKTNELNAIKITLRRNKMKNFLHQTSLALAQDKEFLGLNLNAYNKYNLHSFTFGIKNQGIYAAVNKNESKIKFGFYITLSFKNITSNKAETKQKVIEILNQYNLLLNEKFLL